MAGIYPTVVLHLKVRPLRTHFLLNRTMVKKMKKKKKNNRKIFFILARIRTHRICLQSWVLYPLDHGLEHKKNWLIFYDPFLILVIFCLRPTAKDLGITWVVVLVHHLVQFLHLNKLKKIWLTQDSNLLPSDLLTLTLPSELERLG